MKRVVAVHSVHVVHQVHCNGLGRIKREVTMAGFLKISEAASLAFHAMYLLSKSGGKKLSTVPMAKKLNVSSDHLAKVMQRLVSVGYVKSLRGPHGGFFLAQPASKITLMQIYEAIHGKFTPSCCLLKKPVCSGGQCILGGLLHKVDQEISEHLKSTRLSYFTV